MIYCYSYCTVQSVLVLILILLHVLILILTREEARRVFVERQRENLIGGAKGVLNT